MPDDQEREQSALLLPVPAAEQAVGEHRARLDASARDGVPAHLTVLYPFLPPALIGDAVLASLRRLFAGFPAFAFTLDRVCWFGQDVVWLGPRDPAPFQALLAATWAAFPRMPADPTYSEPLVKAWNAKVKGADAFVIVTPEYNHSVPGGLKNAIDSVWVSYGFRNKPVACVSYAGGQTGGVRAIEHLAHIFVEAEAAPVRNSVVIPFVRDAFDAARA